MRVENIKFRGKSKKTGEWLYGDLEYNRKKGIARIHTYTPDGEYEGQEIVDEETVGQFLCTIYHDDGTSGDVYIGDVVSIGRDDGTRELAEIEGFSDWYVEMLYDVILEGNIHDNPELLDKIAEEYDRRASAEP